MGSVLLAVKMGTSENTVTIRAIKDILVETVLLFVRHIAKHVDTQTDIVAVLLVIQGTDVPQHVFNHMERIVRIHAVNTVTIRTVTNLTEVV